MSDNLPVYYLEFNKNFIRKGVECAFSYIEILDDVVGTIYGTPKMIKKVVLAFPDEAEFDYVYQGIGRLRTAYLKYLPTTRDNELIFLNRDETYKLKLLFI